VKALVTGSSGFIGTHLTRELIVQGYSVVTLQRRAVDPTPGVRSYIGSIEDASSVDTAIRDSQSDVVFHLAAQSSPKLSWDNRRLTLRTNLDGTINVLDAIRKYSNHSRFVMVSSSAIYNEHPHGLALSEDDVPNPTSPYGVSKISAEFICHVYAKQFSTDCVIVRPFFIIGPEKYGDVCSDWAKQIVRIENGLQKQLEVGNLEIVRDFMHISDAVTALIAVSQKGLTNQTYNISSGRGVSLQMVVDVFRSLSRSEIRAVKVTDRVSRSDELAKVGSNDKLRALGWSEQLSYATALHEIMNYWRIQGNNQLHLM